MSLSYSLSQARQTQKHIVDLRGPEGNAFYLLGLASDLYDQLGRSSEEREALRAEMTSGDYVHLVKVFEREFTEYVALIIPEVYHPDFKGGEQ